MNEAKHWDSVAHSYQQTYAKGQSEYNTLLMDFLRQNCALSPASRVIDIGCGVGKYGVYLANLGCDVTLTDISPKMLDYARQNMEQTGKRFSIFPCDWSEVDPTIPQLSPKFTLSISTMSPAIASPESVEKMSGITEGFCFVTRFSSWESPLEDHLSQSLGLEKLSPFSSGAADCANLIQNVSAAGYVPRVHYADYCWSDTRTSAEAAERFISRYLDRREDIDPAAVAACAAQLADKSGMVIDAVNTKVAWIYWNTEEKQ